jgi:hypothetical protein
MFICSFGVKCRRWAWILLPGGLGVGFVRFVACGSCVDLGTRQCVMTRQIGGKQRIYVSCYTPAYFQQMSISTICVDCSAP